MQRNIVGGIAINDYMSSSSLQKYKVSPSVSYRWIAEVEYKEFLSTPSKDKRIAFGNGRNKSEALLKGTMEGLEAYACSCVRVDKVARGNELSSGSFLDPRTVVPYEAWQLPHLKKAKPFIDSRPWQWVEGYFLKSGKTILVPIDMAFFPLSPKSLKRPRCYRANSSGVAAHYSKTAAIHSAVLELIERDALMLTWYSRRKVHLVPRANIPREVEERIAALKEKALAVKILDISVDSVPVVLCLISHSDGQTGFYVGSSAAPRLEEAITKAYFEAEIAAVTWQPLRPKKVIRKKVKSFSDHGFLHFNPESMSQIRWLIETETIAPQKKEKRTDFLHQFDPVIVDLTPPSFKSLGVHVIRAISEKLLPMNVGYGTEHRLHRRFDDLKLSWQQSTPSYPHFIV